MSVRAELDAFRADSMVNVPVQIRDGIIALAFRDIDYRNRLDPAQITGALKGIGRAAANALADSGWSVIGVARTSRTDFPGEFIEIDLADRAKTEVSPRTWLRTGTCWGL